MIGPSNSQSDSVSRPGEVELSFVIPCLNEVRTVGICAGKAARFLSENGVVGEVIVADNGSDDGSVEVAEAAGAFVVNAATPGYGAALMAGIEAACGRFVIMGDADDSYNFLESRAFVEELRKGADIVLGDRFAGGIDKGAMPFLHRYLGNPLLSYLGRKFFRSSVADFYCGLRGFRRDKVVALKLRSLGMEYATEMVAKAALTGLRIAEVPVRLYPDGRGRPAHLKTWRDGWRTLRFYLLHAPNWLFIYPGIALFVVATLFMMRLFAGPLRIGAVGFDVHTMLYCAALAAMGFQAVCFGALTKIFALTEGFIPVSRRSQVVFRYITLEVGLICGSTLFAIGVAIAYYALGVWQLRNFGAIQTSDVMRWVVLSVFCLVTGLQTILNSFFMSVLSLARRRD